jgi:hypothetical protein
MDRLTEACTEIDITREEIKQKRGNNPKIRQDRKEETSGKRNRCQVTAK